ncbi:MFS transporter [Cytobacillus oceanisediminis]|uniref:MFS transporter n=2 Tax=Cytobacillus oceanisediminis TaxID=665099 RepID=A0A160M7L0_9BACI|nr:MFS transporter [Cytobacillus oceanisediminis]AND38254.1 MFS transporter [Cytobacillus oceanisediminis 2691]OHX48153.1 MFS transporter [Cytobacillus oceanisediminis]
MPVKNSEKVLAPQSAWLQSCINSSEKQQQLYKRTLIVIVISQIFGGAGLAAGITVGALLAQNMMGTDSVTGIPTALFTLGSAGTALLVGRLSQRFGRRPGLAAGFLAGGIGAIGVVVSSLTNSILLLFISLLIYGAGTATNLQARYAGTDMANPAQRAKAISMAMVSTTFGAVAGPNLVGVMGDFAISIGVPALAGPFILAAAAYILAGFVLFMFLRPDPFIVAKAISDARNKTNHLEKSSNLASIKRRGIFAGAGIMVLTQFVMMAIMTMTPIHMGHHGHALNEVGLVIGFHIGAMFLPSLLTGFLVDKIGRAPMAIASAITLLASGILAAAGPADSMAALNLALVLLGLGWNFGLISGTAILVDSTHASTRAKTQGSIDVWIALSGALGGGVSGIVVAYSSYAALSISGAILSLLLIPIVFWAGIHQKEKSISVSD